MATPTTPAPDDPVANYDYSLSEKHQELCRLVREEYGEYTYVADVFDTYVVFEKGNTYYQLGYTETEGVLALSDEKPAKVARHTVYEPITNVRTSDMPLTPQQRQALIDDLTTNCDCWKGQGDKDLLTSFTDDKLTLLRETAVRTKQAVAIANTAIQGFQEQDGTGYRLNPQTRQWERAKPVVPPTPKSEPTANSGDEPPAPQRAAPAANAALAPAAQPRARPVTTEEWIKGAPLEVQAQFRAAQTILQEKKEKIVNELLANVSEKDRPIHRERFMAMELDHLAQFHSVMPKAPAPGPEPTANRRPERQKVKRTRTAHDDDLLLMPQMNWEATGDPLIPTNHTVTEEVELVDGRSEEDELQNLPAHVRERMKTAFGIMAEEKAKVINQLVEGLPEQEEQRLSVLFNKKELPELRELLILKQQGGTPAPKGGGFYSGTISLPTPTANQTSNQDDLLIIPRIDYTEGAIKLKRA